VWLFSDSVCFKEVLISTPPGGGLNSPDEGDDCFPPNVHTTFHSFHQPWEVEGSQHMSSYSHHHLVHHHHHAFSTTTSTIAPSPFSFHPMYCPDIVPIKVVTQSLSLALSCSLLLSCCLSLFNTPSVSCCNSDLKLEMEKQSDSTVS